MKKLITLVLAVVCMFSLIACTGQSCKDPDKQGGISTDEDFDIAVSYANWGNLAEIYTKPLNIDKM